MIDALDALAAASQAYRSKLVAVRADQWEQPSVCDGWSVRDVADHILGGNRFAPPLLAGATTEDAFAAALAPGFDGDPVELFDASVGAQLEAFGAPGALDTVVAHPAGPTKGRTFCGLRTGDLLLHGWDIARSTGGDPSLDEELAAFVYAELEPRLRVPRPGMPFAPPLGSVAADAPIVERLLDLTGRA